MTVWTLYQVSKSKGNDIELILWFSITALDSSKKNYKYLSKHYLRSLAPPCFPICKGGLHWLISIKHSNFFN